MNDKVPLWQKITLVTFGLLLTVVFLEAGLRLGGFILLSVQEYGNRQSLQQKGAYRIMCLGESTTANQYPPHLEKILNQRHTGMQFSVIDKGVNGTNSAVILAQLESNLDQYRPDMVVAMMGINDEEPHMSYEAVPVPASEIMRFFKSFRTYKLTRLLWLHILTKVREEGACKKAIARNPQNDRAYVELGQLYQSQGKLSQAEDAFKQAIARNPQNNRAYVELGQLDRAQGKLSQAEDAFKQAIARNPQNDDAYIGLGWAYRDKGQLSQAEDLLKKAIALNPQNDRAYIRLGWVYRDKGQLSQAEDAFKQAIALNPQNAGACTELGKFYRIQGQLSQAEDLLKQAIALNPRNAGTYTELGKFYRIQGRLSQAEDLLKQAIALNPQNDGAYRALSVLYEETGKPGLAKEYAQKADRLRSGYYTPLAVNNYRKLKAISDKRGIHLVCVQYPMRSIEPLRMIFEGGGKEIIFVDNKKVFKDAVKKDGYNTYFVDMFGGDFGHCTVKGNRLLAENIANTILKEVFHKQGVLSEE